MPSKRKVKVVGVGEAWLQMLRFVDPELCRHGWPWAIEALIADRAGIHRPATPATRSQAAAQKKRTKQAGR